MEKLEHQLEREEAKTRRLEEETNLSLQEVSKRQAMEEDYKRRERLQMERMQELERELESKNDLVSQEYAVQLVYSAHLTTTTILNLSDQFCSLSNLFIAFNVQSC